MAKKDLRNCHELGRWKPSKWRHARVVRARNQTLEHAYQLLCCDVGAYEAGLLLVETRAFIGAAISRDAVHAAGLKTIGE